MKMRFFIAAMCMVSPAALSAEDLFKSGGWASLASDRRAEAVGDIVTILVFENSTATNTVSKGSKKRTAVDGQVSFGGSFEKSGASSLGGSYDGQGATSRSGRVVAQISATVQLVLPNGDFMIHGWQRMKVNGEFTNIGVSGRVRRDDLSGNNEVRSTRIADSRIEYDGKGFASTSAKPGLVAKIFHVFGLL
jgi:flagellar L-ring protein FlgH